MQDSVTVYGFQMWSKTAERYVVSRYKAPRHVLDRYDVIVLEGSGEQVPQAALDERGRYLSPQVEVQDSGWRASSMDLMNGLDVIESPT